MVKIRLQRRGRKQLPVYKIVAVDSRAPRDGRFIEALGQYDPLARPAGITLNQERVMYWLGVGAQPTDTVRSLLRHEGVLLRVHLARKGRSEEEIAQTLAEWQRKRDERAATAKSRKQRRADRKSAEASEAPADAPAEA